MRALTLSMLFVLSIFGAQLVRIQGLDSQAVASEAQADRVKTQRIPAMRGQILSSDGIVLASNTVKETLIADPTAVCTYRTTARTCDPTTSRLAVMAAATELAPLLKVPATTLIPKLTVAGTTRYVVLSREITPLQGNRITELGIPGIYLDAVELRSERTYPQGTTSASLVGYVTRDGKPGAGIEVMMDKHLKGTPGWRTFERSGSGAVIPSSRNETTEAIDGQDVTLTLNSNLQWYSQNAIAQKVKETGALSGTVIIMEVKTGKLLAAASYPTFDPVKDIGKAGVDLSNKALVDVFEPGSTAKVMTISSALEEGLVLPDTPVEIPNRLHRSDKTFQDSHDHGVELRTVSGTLAESSNIGTMLIGERLTPEKQESWLRKFGMGQTSGMGYPAESRGILPSYKDWSGSQRYTIMFGSGISLTAIQATGVYQTIANKGVRIPARVIESTTDADGVTTPMPAAAPVRVVSEKTSAEVSRMLEAVVTDGTATRAQIPGYRVAGKTGTAQRYDVNLKQYSGKTGSFIGYAPADNPQLVIAVILQRPIRGNAGGVVAAPVFKDVMSYALQELKIPPTGVPAPPITLRLDRLPSDANADVVRNKRTTGGG